MDHADHDLGVVVGLVADERKLTRTFDVLRSVDADPTQISHCDRRGGSWDKHCLHIELTH